MAQENNSVESNKSYVALGDEVAAVLTSAREAAAEMREQAKHYADALLAGTEQEIAERSAQARADAETVVTEAKEEAARILLDARRTVLSIVEAAQARVEAAERAAAEAVQRRDDMLKAEADLENGVNKVIVALQAELENLRAGREEEPEVAEGETPSEALAELLASSASAMLEAENESNQQ